METTFWWYRLHTWQWIQAGGAKPLRRAFALLVWWCPCVVGPLALRTAGAASSSAALDFLGSLDVPLTLLLAGAVTLDALTVESHTGDEDWIGPRGFRPARLRWMSLQRWLFVTRWPVGLVIAVYLLAIGTSSPSFSLSEALLMSLLALVCGAGLAWAIQHPASRRQPSGINRLQGVAALSWVALRETRNRFDLRRATLLAVPMLLAAPLGATAGQVGKMLALWLPLMFTLIICREASQAQAALQRWLRGMRHSPLWLTYWVWRFTVPGIAAIGMLGFIWWRIITEAPGTQP